MDMYSIIAKKRDGGELTREQIREAVMGYTAGEIPDYKMSALLMAVFIRGMSHDETLALTEAMLHSGDIVDLSDIPGVKVDKHSTGGVGDKTTLIAAPIAAACGVPVAKMSGRGLGFTGGTVDKADSIPGFRTSLTPAEFKRQVKEIGLSLIGQTANVAPADKKIYALRDVTATVESPSLITASVMSKKLAAGSDAIVLDVKCGRGAFMQTYEEAVRLGSLMTEIGTAAGKKAVAVITDMDQPLGHAVGNSLEVIEAIDVLKGEGPEDIRELSIMLAGLMIYCGDRAKDESEGMRLAREALDSGRALKKFKEFIVAQGADERITEDYALFKQPKLKLELKAERDGYVDAIDAKVIGRASQLTGAGRARKEDGIDFSAGIYLLKKTGDRAEKGETLAELFSDDGEKLRTALSMAGEAYSIGERPPEKNDMVKKIIKSPANV